MFNKELTPHLAELSKIRFTAAEQQKLAADMENIVELMDTLSQFDEEGDFALLSPKELSDLREDSPKESTERKDILSNASKTHQSFFEVPKVV